MLCFPAKRTHGPHRRRSFVELDKEFHFDLDPCADEFNHKCEKYYTIADNGLLKEWGGIGYFAIPRMAGK